jgi:hypothetical protein
MMKKLIIIGLILSVLVNIALSAYIFLTSLSADHYTAPQMITEIPPLPDEFTSASVTHYLAELAFTLQELEMNFDTTPAARILDLFWPKFAEEIVKVSKDNYTIRFMMEELIYETSLPQIDSALLLEILGFTTTDTIIDHIFQELINRDEKYQIDNFIQNKINDHEKSDYFYFSDTELSYAQENGIVLDDDTIVQIFINGNSPSVLQSLILFDKNRAMDIAQKIFKAPYAVSNIRYHLDKMSILAQLGVREMLPLIAQQGREDSYQTPEAIFYLNALIKNHDLGNAELLDMVAESNIQNFIYDRQSEQYEYKK